MAVAPQEVEESPEKTGDKESGVPRISFLIGCFALLAVWVTAGSGPLAWDEAVFALAGRNLETMGFHTPLQNLPAWSALRAPGLPYLLGVAFKFLPATDFVARSVSVAGSAFLLLVIWKLVTRFANSNAGLITVTIIALTPGFLLTGTLAFGDNLAAGFGLYAVFLAVRYVDEGGSRSVDHYLILIPLLLSVATVIRYGVPFLVLLPLFATACTQLLYGIREKNLRKILKLWGSLGLSALAIWIILFRDPLSSGKSAAIARSDSTSSPYLKGVKELLLTLSPGKVHYGFGGHFWGLTFFAIIVIPLAFAVVICLLGFDRKLESLFLVVVAIFPMLGYSVVTRLFTVTYGGPLVAFSIAVGVVIISRSGMEASIGTLWSRGWGRVVIMIVVAVAGLSSVSAVRSDHQGLEGFRGISQMAELAGVIGGQSCTIRTQRGPQVAWYSGCKTRPASPSSLGVTSSEELGIWIDAEAAKLEDNETILFVLLENLRNQIEIGWFEKQVSENVQVVSVGSGRRSVLVTIMGG